MGPEKRKIVSRVLAGGLLASVGLVVLLGIRYQELADRYEQLNERSRYPYPGLQLPRSELTTVGGEKVVIGASDSHQLLYFFTTTCPYCRRSVDTWRRVAQRAARDSRLGIIGVAFDSLEDTRAYVREHGLRGPVALAEGDERRIASLYRVGGVPLTVMLNPDGRVVYVRRGTFDRPDLVDSVFFALEPDDTADRPDADSLASAGGSSATPGISRGGDTGSPLSIIPPTGRK